MKATDGLAMVPAHLERLGGPIWPERGALQGSKEPARQGHGRRATAWVSGIEAPGRLPNTGHADTTKECVALRPLAPSGTSVGPATGVPYAFFGLRTIWSPGDVRVICLHPRNRSKMSKLQQFTYLMLKAGNIALAGAWGFAQVYALVRILDLKDYSIVVITTAVGAYVLATDLGLSAVLYTRVRRAFLEGRMREEANFAVTSLVIYGTIAVLAAIAFYGVVTVFSIGSRDLHVGFAAHLLVMALALPWALIRVTMAASDRFLMFESVEFGRRIVIVALPFLMLLGVSYVTFVFMALAVWIAVFSIFLPLFFRTFDLKLTGLKLNFGPFMNARTGQVKWASAYGLQEFFLYNAPYFIVPIISRDPRDLIAFDIFFKITRFGISGHHAINEAMAPVLTRSLHAGNTSSAFRTIGLILLLSFFVAVVGSVTVTQFGDLTFELLLDDEALVPDIVRAAMAGFLVAGAMNMCNASILLFKASYTLLASASLISLTAVAIWAGVIWIFEWGFLPFMVGYTVIYATRSVIMFTITTSQIWRSKQAQPEMSQVAAVTT
ncbi:MAG: hypothetical protein ACFB6R_05460 [Alphaproteobacteria bacterium]